jgi:hypothetical protein
VTHTKQRFDEGGTDLQSVRFLPRGQPTFDGPRPNRNQQTEVAAEKVLFCHPEQSEGSAFLRQTQEKTNSSGKPSPSE